MQSVRELKKCLLHLNHYFFTYCYLNGCIKEKLHTASESRILFMPMKVAQLRVKPKTFHFSGIKSPASSALCSPYSRCTHDLSRAANFWFSPPLDCEVKKMYPPFHSHFFHNIMCITWQCNYTVRPLFKIGFKASSLPQGLAPSCAPGAKCHTSIVSFCKCLSQVKP